MIGALIDRLPLMLLLAVLALAAQVALVEMGQPQRLLACAPAALVGLLYLRAGRRAPSGAAKGGGGDDGPAGRGTTPARTSR